MTPGEQAHIPLDEPRPRGEQSSLRRKVQSSARPGRDPGQRSIAQELEGLLAPRGPRRPLTNSPSRAVPRGEGDIELLTIFEPTTHLDDLVFAPDVRTRLESIVREHAAREFLGAFGVSPRRRLLFVGPSGTGKSQTAQALAAAVGVPVARIRLGSIVSSYLGETARQLDRVLDYAVLGNWVLVIDEIDMLASERTQTDHGEMRRVVAAFLQALEDSHSTNLLVATTNLGPRLDQALWRRFDEVVVFKEPSRDEIQELVRLKLRRLKSRWNKAEVARHLSGMSHAEIEQVCQDAMRTVIMDGSLEVTTHTLIRCAESRRARSLEAGKYFA